MVIGGISQEVAHLRAMSSEVVVGPGGNLLGLLAAGTEAGGVGHPHHASHVGRGQPALLVVIGSRELPAFILTSGERLVLSIVNIQEYTFFYNTQSGFETCFLTIKLKRQNIKLFPPG